MAQFATDQVVIQRIFDHIDGQTTDVGDAVWREPVTNYTCPQRFAEEMALFRRIPLLFCPSSALTHPGDYVARKSAGRPVVVLRDKTGKLRGFHNVCRHRGKQLLQGEGCTKAIVCGYHGWAYQLDGTLQYVPHEEGFPDLDKSTHGLVPIKVFEQDGLVFICQEQPLADDTLATLPPILSPEQVLFASNEAVADVNWKINMEATLEGYHIKPTHKETFYPYGYDNLNVVEAAGPHIRVTFPFQRIEKLRSIPAPQRDISGCVTYAHHIFPNATIAVLSKHTVMVISEPEAPGRTRFVTYRLANADMSGKDNETSVKRDADFVADTGGREDAAVVREIQAGLASPANTHFTYGQYEKGIVHFHKTLTDMLARCGY